MTWQAIGQTFAVMLALSIVVSIVSAWWETRKRGR